MWRDYQQKIVSAASWCASLKYQKMAMLCYYTYHHPKLPSYLESLMPGMTEWLIRYTPTKLSNKAHPYFMELISWFLCLHLFFLLPCWCYFTECKFQLQLSFSCTFLTGTSDKERDYLVKYFSIPEVMVSVQCSPCKVMQVFS